MESIFSFTKLVQHMKMEIPNNIKIGEMENQILSEVSPALLKKVIPQLKKEFLENHKDILNTSEKIEHVQMVLEKVLLQKYNFAKQNIEEGQKFNDFYPDQKIELPKQQKNFQCEFCKERFFKTNASLHSHYRSCPSKISEEKRERLEDEEFKMEKSQGFKPLKVKGPRSSEIKSTRMFAPEIIKQKDEKKENEKKEEEIIGKRSRPGSSCSLGSNIFFEE